LNQAREPYTESVSCARGMFRAFGEPREGTTGVPPAELGLRPRAQSAAPTARAAKKARQPHDRLALVRWPGKSVRQRHFVYYVVGASTVLPRKREDAERTNPNVMNRTILFNQISSPRPPRLRGKNLNYSVPLSVASVVKTDPAGIRSGTRNHHCKVSTRQRTRSGSQRNPGCS
jgi:hypothetical protein